MVGLENKYTMCPDSRLSIAQLLSAAEKNILNSKFKRLVILVGIQIINIPLQRGQYGNIFQR